MSTTQNLICINCPKGCRLTATQMENGELLISGNDCKRGAEYGKQELTMPMRVLTGLMWPADSKTPVSVKSDAPVPKELLLTCAKTMYEIHPALPIAKGDILVADICGTGVNIIATRPAR